MEVCSHRLLSFVQKSILLECETQVECLLAIVFENYKSLNEQSATGLSDWLTPIPDIASLALAPAVQTFTLLHDILSQEAQTILQRHLQVIAKVLRLKCYIFCTI
ncbi:Myosin IE heavy chain [Bienertia sinuspersici]